MRYVTAPVSGSVVELSCTASRGWPRLQAIPARSASARAVPLNPPSALVDKPGMDIEKSTAASSKAAAEEVAERVGEEEREGETPGRMLSVGVGDRLGVRGGVPLMDTEGVSVRAGVRVRLVLGVPVMLGDEVDVWVDV